MTDFELDRIIFETPIKKCKIHDSFSIFIEYVLIIETLNNYLIIFIYKLENNKLQNMFLFKKPFFALPTLK